MTAPPVYRLQLFAKPALFDGENREIRLLTKKAILLLAILASDDQLRWPRADLASLVWPESSPEMARSSLRTAIRMIRKATVANSIFAEGDEIWLDRSLFLVDLDGPEGVRRPPDFFPGSSNEWVAERRRMLGSARPGLQTGEESSLSPAAHPLVPAGEYLLAWDPEQALEFLASTQLHWKSAPVKLAADLHRRVLRGARSTGATRRRVEAMAIWLDAVQGILDPFSTAVRQKLSRSISEADRANAALIAGAISIAAQQRGALDRAYKYARIGAKILLETSEPDARPRAIFQLANIERHCGLYDLARSRNLGAMREYQEIGSTHGVAMAHMTAATDCIWQKDLGGAADHLDCAREYFQATGNERITPWIVLADAWLAESSANPLRARQILTDLRNDEGDRNGLAFQAGVEDHLLLANNRLGELDESAAAWGKARQIRRISGLAPSAFERDLSRASKLFLKERLGLAQLRDHLATRPA